jgi:hypothetical protein
VDRRHVFSAIANGGTEIKIAGLFKKSVELPAAPPQRFERKFYIVPANLGLAYVLLRQVCRPDREFPRDTVHSLYFDTPDLDQYEKSAAGEHRKDKVRIRWYVDSHQETGDIPVYIELKSRQGFASSKQRRRMLVPASQLEPPGLAGGIVSRITLLETLAGFGYFPEKPLQPVILITYLRYRFNEVLTGDRVSFDRDIRARMVAPAASRPSLSGEISLPGGVIEVKGPTLALPATLRSIKLLDVAWSRFSKYGSCLDAYFSEPGSVARTSPSGKIIAFRE